MNFNVSQLLELRSLKSRFEKNHPKFLPFFRAAERQALREGSVIEITVTSPEGETISSNIKVLPDDLDLIRRIQELGEMQK